MKDRELDAAIAEKVMGFKRATAETAPSFAYNIDVLKQTWFLSEHEPGKCFSVPEPYSTDIAAAWQVVMSPKFPSWAMKHDNESKLFTVQIEHDGNRYFEQADTAPRAICLAALKAVGVDITQEKT